MKRLLSVLSLGLVLSVSAQAGLNCEDTELVRKIYHNLGVMLPFREMNVEKQADFIFSGLSIQEFHPNYEDILPVVKAEKEFEKVIIQLYSGLCTIAPAFHELDDVKKTEDVFYFFKIQNPDSNRRENHVGQILSNFLDVVRNASRID